jgi:hypothetical protein
MKIFQSRKLTDAEFVEKVRKQAQSAKRRAWILLAFSILYSGLIVFIWCIAKNWISPPNGVALPDFYRRFFIKALIYFAFFLNHLFGYRTEKLLIAALANPQNMKLTAMCRGVEFRKTIARGVFGRSGREYW